MFSESGSIAVPMRMRMGEAAMAMRVRVRLALRVAGGMLVPVMRVVHVAVRVLQRLVDMLMRVPLGEMQPDAYAHEHAGRGELPRDRLAEQRHGENGADEGRRREIGRGARGAEMAERQHEQRDAYAIAEEAHDRAGCNRAWPGQ